MNTQSLDFSLDELNLLIGALNRDITTHEQDSEQYALLIVRNRLVQKLINVMH